MHGKLGATSRPSERILLAFHRSSAHNKILSHLSADQFGLLAPYLELVPFVLRQQIETPQQPIGHIIFPEDGIASLVAKSPAGRDIEIGLVGSEGMTGTSLLLGAHSSPLAVYIQLAGSGFRISAENFRTVMEKDRGLQQRLLLYAQSLVVQTATTSLVNGQANAETRLARWLLMVHDRTTGNELYLTHEFMSVMLGVRRPWVTETLHILEGKGYIRSLRGKVIVRNREGLIEDAQGYYGLAEREYEKLLGFSIS
jgi:CRP-like cAMP-binding protein